jgi:hypothetical protein
VKLIGFSFVFVLVSIKGEGIRTMYKEDGMLTMKKRNDLLQQANEPVSFLKLHMISKHIVSGTNLCHAQ